MGDWLAMSVLPNVELEVPLEGGLAVLAPSTDPRVIEIGRKYPNFKSFLGRFTDQFGQKLHPSVLLVRGDAPKSIFTVEAIASFRDLIAISVIPYNRARELVYRRGQGLIYSNIFWLHPWMMDKNYEHLIAHTFALLGLDDVSEFKGQSSPELSPRTLAGLDIDEPLLRVLIKRWHRRYTGRSPRSKDRALFRSLNMANHASQLPAGSDTTFYDVGRSIALWVSAFEILAHPGKGWSGLGPVYGLLERTPWVCRPSRMRRYKAYAGKKPPTPRPIACWMYGEIYRARNAFLHGNRVSPAQLTVRRSNRSLFLYAAPLYRLALTAFLPLTWSKPLPPIDPVKFGRHLVDRMDFLSYQRRIENAIHTARKVSPVIRK